MGCTHTLQIERTLKLATGKAANLIEDDEQVESEVLRHMYLDACTTARTHARTRTHTGADPGDVPVRRHIWGGCLHLANLSPVRACMRACARAYLCMLMHARVRALLSPFSSHTCMHTGTCAVHAMHAHNACTHCTYTSHVQHCVARMLRCAALRCAALRCAALSSLRATHGTHTMHAHAGIRSAHDGQMT